MENASALRSLPGQQEEARARELAAVYVRELIWVEKVIHD